MGSEEQKGRSEDGVRLFAGLVAVAIDFVSTATGLWGCRRRGCSKKEKALLRKRRNAYIRWVRDIIREAVRSE